MKTQRERRKEAMKRRNAQEEALMERLAAGGRVPVERFRNGSVRTTVYVGADPAVPIAVEQTRFYSTSGFDGCTSLLEASDLIHARRGLSAAQAFIGGLGRPLPLRRVLPREVILRAINRGYNPPKAQFIEGNVAALLWTNDVNDGVDFVAKVEMLAVTERGEAEVFYEQIQLGNAIDCMLRAEEEIERIGLTYANSR